MKEIVIDTKLISCCWLYCGVCKKYLQEKCPGCHNLEKTPFWCKIRDCCLSHGYQNCSECNEYDHIKECKKFNGFIMRSLAKFCGSDQWAAIEMIRKNGDKKFIEKLVHQKSKRIKRN